MESMYTRRQWYLQPVRGSAGTVRPPAGRHTPYAIQDALTWMSHRTPEQIWDAIPARYRMERELDLETLRGLMPSFSPDGTMPHDGAEAVRKSMSIISDKIRAANFDLASTYANEFLSRQ
jgi:NitT/TauT family transport system substrate-binding protein